MHSPLSAGRGGGEGLTSFQIFKKGVLGKTLVFRGGLVGKRGVRGGREGYNFYVKNKLKSEIFNDKKVDKQRCFSLS